MLTNHFTGRGMLLIKDNGSNYCGTRPGFRVFAKRCCRRRLRRTGKAECLAQ